MERHRSQEKLASERAVANVSPSAGSNPVLTTKIISYEKEIGINGKKIGICV